MSALPLTVAATMRRMHDPGRAVDLYIGELARRGRTKATRTKYLEVLTPFSERHRDKLLWDITADDCRAYLDRWRDAAPSTLALYVTILRGFFQFLQDEQIIEQSPMERIRRPPRKRPEDLDVVTVSDTDVERLYGACEDWDDLLCLAVLSYLGPRRTAAARTRRGDVDLNRGTVRFHEKGGKVIVKPLPHELAEIIRAADEEGVWASPATYLIPNRRPCRRLERSPKVIYAIVKRLADRAGVNVHPHALRAAFAVRFDEQHPDLVLALRDLLGHARLETTEVYLRRRDKQRGMEPVRDLSWGPARVTALTASAPSGIRTRATDLSVPEPLRLKLDELRARSRGKARA